MKYRHSFHAGNFADTHKHVTLLALLRAMQRKDKGFLFVDTHAGAGRYDLGGADTHHGAEAKFGANVVIEAADALQSEELQAYVAAVRLLRTTLDLPLAYPGSPWLAAQMLRPQDSGVCCELVPAQCRALERSLGGFRRMRVQCADGYLQLAALLPPRERRCLVLIDPPYENPSLEFAQAADVIDAILARQANAVIALWYPIKDTRSLLPWQQRMAQQSAADVLSLEFWIHPRDSRVGLNGSGLMIINPPYQFEQAAALWQQELQRLLDQNQHGGNSVRWLVHRSDSNHVGS